MADTGCRIGKDDFPKVFAPFFTTKKKGSGTGLGLSLSDDVNQAEAIEEP